jgi:hypothetical protein
VGGCGAAGVLEVECRSWRGWGETPIEFPTPMLLAPWLSKSDIAVDRLDDRDVDDRKAACLSSNRDGA